MLARLGWTPAIEDQFAPHAAAGLEPARVAAEHRGAYSLYSRCGERSAELAGRLRQAADSRDELPAVGGWVAVADPDGAERALVQAVLPRRTKFSRMAATGTLASERLAGWRKLQTELRHLAVKQDARLRSEARKQRRRFARSMRKTSW